MPNTINIGEIIRKARLKRDLTQGELGNLVGRSKQNVCDIEKGRKKDLKSEMLIKFADALRINPNIFLPKRYSK